MIAATEYKVFTSKKVESYANRNWKITVDDFVLRSFGRFGVFRFGAIENADDRDRAERAGLDRRR